MEGSINDFENKAIAKVNIIIAKVIIKDSVAEIPKTIFFFVLLSLEKLFFFILSFNTLIFFSLSSFLAMSTFEIILFFLKE
jgi:hypothetical protein